MDKLRAFDAAKRESIKITRLEEMWVTVGMI